MKTNNNIQEEHPIEKISRFIVITCIFIVNMYYAGIFLHHNYLLLENNQNELSSVLLGGAFLTLSYKFSGFVVLEFRNVFNI